MDQLVWFYPQGHEAHVEYGHPERPERIEAIVASLEDTGWWETYPRVGPDAVDDEILEAVHAPAYLRQLEQISALGGRLDMDTYTTRSSWELAHKAAGGSIAVSRRVWQAEAARGFALTRPPGHHATRDRGMGFCLLNNVAIATEYLLQRAGAMRLAIVDLDLHHGNGTQDIFWGRDDVFYISTHQYPHYPGTGRLSEVGEGRGKGFTANFPMPQGSGDEAYGTVMESAILPLLDRFQAEMLLVSYGFDTHWLDPLGHIALSAAGYRRLVASLVAWADTNCQGRIALFLEGGYDLDAAAACTLGVTSALLGLEWQDPLGPSPRPESQDWRSMLAQARQLWGLE
jgi:acetoin utilization deacetylase AcuC-like enzyme